jgi:hypothetical protein
MTQPDPNRDHDDRNPQSGHKVLWVVVGAIAVTAAVIIYLIHRYPGALQDNPLERPRLVYLALWGGALGASLIVHWRARPGQALRYVAVWLAIGAALMLGYNLYLGHMGGP